jgi:hypothetical protein
MGGETASGGCRIFIYLHDNRLIRRILLLWFQHTGKVIRR